MVLVNIQFGYHLTVISFLHRNIPFCGELEVKRHMATLQRLNIQFFKKFVIL